MRLVWWCSLALAGWLGDGSHVWADGVQAGWTPDDWVWSTPLAGWSNASPVILGDKVCVTEEPDVLTCLSAQDGRVLWRVETPFAETLQGEARTAWEAKVAAAEAARAELKEITVAYSRLQREARRGNPDAAQQLTQLLTRQAALQQTVDAAIGRMTPANQGILGYATSTPATDGTALVALYGHGVATRLEADGTRSWVVDLGPPQAEMRGYHEGHAASPLWVGDTVVLPRNQLVAVAARTGERRWEAGPYPHFGSPAAMSVGGQDLVLTPDGRALDLQTGAVVRQGLGNRLYVGPHVHGDVACWIGNTRSADGPGSKPVEGSCWRVGGQRGALTWTKLWERELADDRFYTSPFVAEGVIHLVTAGGTVVRVGLEDGRPVGTPPPGMEPLVSTIYPSPVRVGATTYLAGEDGTVLGYRTSDLTDMPARHKVEPFRSTPVSDGDRLYVRTLVGLLAIGR